MLLSKAVKYSHRFLPVQYQSYAFLASKCAREYKVAVILSGCGVYDGTEIHEAAAVMAYLSKYGAEPICFAPEIPQLHVIDHLKGKVAENDCRDVLVESARIARGNVYPLVALNKDMADALVFPGGFGAAKNLSNWAMKGVECDVNPHVVRVLKEFHKAHKPIGLCCIAPVLAAKVLCGLTLTVGKRDDGSGKWPYGDTVDLLEKLGTHMEEKEVTEVSCDMRNLVLSTPAFMYNGKYHEINEGIGSMIKKLMSIVRN